MADTKITGLPALPDNRALLLPLSAVPTAILPLATQANVSNAQATIYQWQVACTTLFYTDILNLKTLATATLNVPAGFVFFVEECFVIATTIAALGAQPIVSMGTTLDPVKYVDNLQLTLLTATNTRERIAVNGSDGEADLTVTVDVIATGTTVSGRFGFRGVLFPT